MKKRMISLVLALAMCLSLCATVFADSGASIEGKKAYLQNVANIPANFLNSVEDETILSIYEEVVVNGAAIVSYDEVTENMESSTQMILPMASIPSDDFEMSTIVLGTPSKTESKILYPSIYSCL